MFNRKSVTPPSGHQRVGIAPFGKEHEGGAQRRTSRRRRRAAQRNLRQAYAAAATNRKPAARHTRRGRARNAAGSLRQNVVQRRRRQGFSWGRMHANVCSGRRFGFHPRRGTVSSQDRPRQSSRAWSGVHFVPGVRHPIDCTTQSQNPRGLRRFLLPQTSSYRSTQRSQRRHRSENLCALCGLP